MNEQPVSQIPFKGDWGRSPQQANLRRLHRSQIPFKGDWGRFLNKKICEDCTGGEIEKMSEPVQVYTACQFANL